MLGIFCNLIFINLIPNREKYYYNTVIPIHKFEIKYYAFVTKKYIL